MKFDTSSGPAGNSALLESRILYPKREEQCLQFFYKMTGVQGDRLVIWVRTDDGTGNITSVKKVHTITGIFLLQQSMAKFKHDHHIKSFSLVTQTKDGVCSRFTFDEWQKRSFLSFR